MTSAKSRTETLTIGDRAPLFVLRAANRTGNVALAELISHGTVLVEFLRGTW